MPTHFYSLSRIALVFCCAVQLYLGAFYYPKWQRNWTEASISHDAAGYYLYLPAVFIYHDLKRCAFADEIVKKYQPVSSFSTDVELPNGNYIMKYSCGQAIMVSPAFFAAHAYCLIAGGYPADGFSRPYQFAFWAWCLLLAWLGLWGLRVVMLHYFSDGVVALTLVSIALCTNYLDYSAISNGLTHSNLFTLYVGLLLATIRFYKRPNGYLALAIGLLCGLAATTRPTEIMVTLIPIFWGVYDVNTLRKRFWFFVEQRVLTAFIMIGFLAVAMVQPLYWHYVSGSWLVYSYGQQGFDWLHPHYIKCLFHANAGWLRYSPVIVFAFIGVLWLKRIQPALFPLVLMYGLLATYVCFAWSEWWYGWSLGQRAMVQSYPIWAFGFGGFYSSILKNRYLKWLVIFVFPVLLYYNAWCIYQSHTGGLLKGPEMNNAYFNAIVGRWHVADETQLLLDHPDQAAAKFSGGQEIFSARMLNDTLPGLNGRLVQGNEVLPLAQLKLQPNARAYAISLRGTCTEQEWNNWLMAQLVVMLFSRDHKVDEQMIRINRVMPVQQPGEATMFVSNHAVSDSMAVQVYLPEGGKPVFIDGLRIRQQGF
ncbi:MAG: hypothetical protein U0T84_04680 [Chitinophagales bacterium]